MEEENGTQNPAEELLAGKFKSVDALVRAYGELEAEFTRRNQRLKALQEAQEQRSEAAAQPSSDGEQLYRAASENETVRARILGDYLKGLHGVPLMGGAGAGVPAPATAPKTFGEAGALALSYLRKQNS